MALLDALAVALIVGLSTSVVVRFLLVWLRKKSILDQPNERSSHETPTPRGGGIAVIVSIVGALFFLGSNEILIVLVATLGLAAISWIDDLRPTHPGVRLAIHILCVSGVLYWLPLGTASFDARLPAAVWLILIGLSWVWFINLYNFMDGIDGITSVETVSVCLGILAVGTIAPLTSELQLLAVVVAGSMMGFALWNWHPAKIFLGDVGSVPLGFLLGWMLIELAEQGHIAAALILPAYYVADATVTLVRRALKRERIWQAHRSHFYQRAVQAGDSHSKVALKILGMNLLLVCFAMIAASGYEALALAATVVSVTLFLRYLVPTDT